MRERKLRTEGGFTLVEMLCTVAVLLLVSALMVVGVRLAVKTLKKSVMASESRVLCSTLRELVNDELRYSGTVNTANDGTISFFSQNYGGENAAFTTDAEGHVLLNGKKVLADRAYPYAMRASVMLTSYDSVTLTFEATVTVTDEEGNEMISTDFEVKQLNQPADSGT